MGRLLAGQPVGGRRRLRSRPSTNGRPRARPGSASRRAWSPAATGRSRTRSPIELEIRLGSRVGHELLTRPEARWRVTVRTPGGLTKIEPGEISDQADQQERQQQADEECGDDRRGTARLLHEVLVRGLVAQLLQRAGFGCERAVARLALCRRRSGRAGPRRRRGPRSRMLAQAMLCSAIPDAWPSWVRPISQPLTRRRTRKTNRFQPSAFGTIAPNWTTWPTNDADPAARGFGCRGRRWGRSCPAAAVGVAGRGQGILVLEDDLAGGRAEASARGRRG